MADAHSLSHKERVQSLDSTRDQPRYGAAGTKQKRKVSSGDDELEIKDALRRKRSRADLVAGQSSWLNKEASQGGMAEQANGGGGVVSKEATLTPPSLSRRASKILSQGIELQIPSRPATPSRREASSSSTPGALPNGPSQTSAPSLSRPELRAPAQTPLSGDDRLSSTTPRVDETEWAAFEAEIAAQSASYDDDAVISAPAMTAEESAAAQASSGQYDDNRKAQVDVDIEEEREEASCAIEDEFHDMQELEERVKRLNEKREALRRRNESQGQETAADKENLSHKEAFVVNDGAINEEGDDEDDEYDDWDAFRFRKS